MTCPKGRCFGKYLNNKPHSPLRRIPWSIWTWVMDNNILLNSLQSYYDKQRYDELRNILDRKNNDVSLRLIDWFITNYAKKKNTRIKTPDGKTINVYVEYKNQLKAFSKKQFDPFCRRDRICFNKYGKQLTTTIGQMNFFRWAIHNNIVNYVKTNNTVIEKDMLDIINNSFRNPNNSKRHSVIMATRKELSSCATKSFTCIQLKSVITLD